MNAILTRLRRSAVVGRAHGTAAGPKAARQVAARTAKLATCLYDLAVLMVCSIAVYTVLLLVGLLVIGLEIWMVLHPLSFGIVVALVLGTAFHAYRRRSALVDGKSVGCREPKNDVERAPDNCSSGQRTGVR